MNPLLREIHSRWDAIFCALLDGDDVAPAQLLRTEGMMEAAVLAGVAEEAEVLAALQERYHAACGRSLEDEFGTQWSVLFPFPQLPAFARRAPVYPSTSD